MKTEKDVRHPGELITRVAKRIKGGRVFSLPAPARHADVASYMATMVEPDDILSAEDGFVTAAGDFLTRHEAAAVAYANGQIDVRLARLTSLDLW